MLGTKVEEERILREYPAEIKEHIEAKRQEEEATRTRVTDGRQRLHGKRDIDHLEQGGGS